MAIDFSILCPKYLIEYKLNKTIYANWCKLYDHFCGFIHMDLGDGINFNNSNKCEYANMLRISEIAYNNMEEWKNEIEVEKKDLIHVLTQEVCAKEKAENQFNKLKEKLKLLYKKNDKMGDSVIIISEKNWNNIFDKELLELIK